MQEKEININQEENRDTNIQIQKFFQKQKTFTEKLNENPNVPI